MKGYMTMMGMIRESLESLERDELVRYFRTLANVFYYHGTPDALQGGISVIRNPTLYDTQTLCYWFSEAKRAGY